MPGQAVTVQNNGAGVGTFNTAGISSYVMGAPITFSQATFNTITASTTVATIAALRALTITPAMTSGLAVQVQGYYTLGDGGGGPTRFLSLGKAPGYYVDNGGSIIVPSGGNGSAAWIWDYSGPVDVRWFGAKGDGVTSDSSAISSAISAAISASSNGVIFPATASGYLITTGFSIAAPVHLRGEVGMFFITANDITAFTFSALAASTGSMEWLEIIGPGTGTSTLPGVVFKNVNNFTMRNCRVRAFNKGIQFQSGAITPQSCYLNSLYNCRIEANGSINIEGQKNTNALLLSGCTVGGGPCAIGVKLVDCNTLAVIGGDAEGLSTCVFDLDASSGSLNAAHTICGFHFEANTSSVGDVRIGNTAAVNGVTLLGNIYSPGSGDDSAVNAIHGDGLVIHGGTINGGYTGVVFQRIGAAFGASWSIVGVAGIGDQIPTTFKTYNQASFPYLAPTSYSSNYTTTGFARYNQVRIQSGDLAAAKYYGAGLDVARLDNNGSAGAGARVYARIFQVSDGAGGGLMRAATLHDGGIDVINGSAAFGQSAAADTLGNGATIETTDSGIPTVVRVNPGAAYTGIILQAGFRPGQMCVVINEAAAANTVTFAAVGTSNVADGTSAVIAGLRCQLFVWNTATSLWYRQ